MHFSHLVKVRKNSHSLSLQAFLTHSHSLLLSLAGLSAMLRDLEWPTLEQRRQHSRLTMLSKIYNRLVNTDFTFHFTLTVQYQRSCLSFPTTTVQLCCLLQLVPSSYYSGLVCADDRSTSFSHQWRLQELPLRWSVISSLNAQFLAWLPFLSTRNMAYPATVCLSSVWSRSVKGRRFVLVITGNTLVLHCTYYIHNPWGDEINFCCFICVSRRWSLHVMKRQLF